MLKSSSRRKSGVQSRAVQAGVAIRRLFGVAALVFAAGAFAAPQHGGSVSLQKASGIESQAQRAPVLGQRKNPGIEVDQDLMRQLQASGSKEFAIEFRDSADLSAAYNMSWNDRGRYVMQRLQETAQRSQANVRKQLDADGVDYKSFWIKNVIVVQDGTRHTLDSLMNSPEIERIRLMPKMRLIDPEPVQPGKYAQALAKAAGSNIAHVGADAVWALGYHGDGVVLGSIDSGVKYTHVALVNQYRGNQGGGVFDHNFNWFDPLNGTLFPAPASAAIADQHGTHTTGTMVGDDGAGNQVGMAPNAKWIACQGFPTNATDDSALLGCGQFMAAPTDLAGANPDPDLRPNAVNNSWGDCGTTVDTFYSAVIDSWNAAGIIPVFSGGNASNCGYSSPPGLDTVGNPGRYTNVFTVGSTGNSNGQYATHSNWGPTDDIARGLPNFPDMHGFDNIKPNVAAPGVSIRSTVGPGDTTFDSVGWSGTSMSAPHVTGLMALMMEAGDCLKGDFGAIGSIIQETATPIDYASGNGDEGPGNVPNHATGWGEINALAAVQAAEGSCGPQGFVEGTVTDGVNPIPNAQIDIFVDEMVKVWSTTTDASGNYSRKVPELTSGGYTVRASAFGFTTDLVTGVLVVDASVTIEDFTLAAAPTHTVSGVVTDTNTNWPLHARISISGYPSSPIYTDPMTGAYSVVLPEGIIFPFTVTSLVPGYVFEQRDVGPLVADDVQDFALDVDAIACSAPGYQTALSSIMTEDFESGSPPTNWTDTSNGAGWMYGTALGSGFFSIPAHTRYAAANDDANNDDASVDFLVSPSMDLSLSSGVVLNFASRFSGQYGSTGAVQGSTDDGVTWPITIGSPVANGSAGPWLSQQMDLSALVGSATARIRFHHNDNANWASGWAVDDVSVAEAACNPPATGGVVIGQVTDANTGFGMNGITVEVDGAGISTSTAANEDPAVGDGAYAMYSPSGAQTINALAPVAPAGYQPASAPAVVVDAAVTQVDLALDAGQLSFNPVAGPEATLDLGSDAVVPFVGTNSGGVSATYLFQAPTMTEDFESGVDANGWTVTNNGGDCVWMTNDDYGDNNLAGGDGLSATANSDACGSGTTMDTTLRSSRLDFSGVSSASLSFMLSYRHLGTQRLDVDVSTNGGSAWTTLQTYNSSVSGNGPGVLANIDLTPYVGSLNTYVRFRFVSTGWNYYAQVDQVRVFGDDLSNIPWLTMVPLGSVLAPAANQNHDAAFDAGEVAQPGAYTAPLRVLHNTPYTVPDLIATMNVDAPASFGTVSGTVQSLGYCDANPAALAGATVLIQGSGPAHLTQTDAAGNYSWQLDSAEGPVVVTVTKSGHVTAAASNVSVNAGGTSTADVDLRSMLPCFDIVEDMLSLSMMADTTDQRQFTLANTGAGDLNPWMASYDDPSVSRDFAMSQSLSATIEAGNGVRCGSAAGTADNFYMRRYDLGGEAFDSNVDITGIRFGVDSATSTAGTQDAEIGLFELAGSFEFGNMTLIGVADVTIPNGSQQSIDALFDAPISVAPNAVLVAVLAIPAHGATDADFFPGTNTLGETAPSYISSDACGFLQPTPYADIGFPDVHLRLDLMATGTHACHGTQTVPSWLLVNPASGSVAADSTASVDADFDTTGLVAGNYTGAVCVESADAFTPLQFVPVLLEVTPALIDVDLSVTLSGTPNPSPVGGNITYEAVVSNAGPEAAADVAVTATVPMGASFDSAGGSNWSCTELAGAIDCQLAGGIAASGTSDTLNIILTGTTAGVLNFTVTAGTSSNDTDGGNNSANTDVTVVAVPTADMSVSGSVSPGSATAGDSVTVSAVATNNGPDSATGVTASFTLPAGFTYAGATGAGWSCVDGGSQVDCTLAGSLASGVAPTLAVDLDVGAGAGFGTQSITIDVSANQFDGNAGNDQASVDVDVLPSEFIFGDGFED